MICAFARLIRWAMVVSGTRNARAISAVVSPPTARKVSATCDGGDSAGWQHRNSSDNVSSVAGAGGAGCSGDSSAATVACFAAPLIGQPPGRDGDQPSLRVVRDAVLGPRDGRVHEGVLHCVLARV